MVLTPSILFISLTGAILLLIGIVVVLEKFVSRKREATLASPEYGYTEELRFLKQANLEPQELLNRIDALAKKALTPNVVQNAQNPQTNPGHLDYSQLAETYKDKPHVVQFCASMTQSLYTGEKITPFQTKNLLHSLEDMLKGEGKLMFVEPKKEIIEEKKTFFLDALIENAARKIHSSLEKKEEEQEAKQKETAEKVESMKSQPEKVQQFRKVRLAVKNNPRSKDREEYNYIESIDVLDRIESKLKRRSTASQ